jgi:hypothetical protein
MLIGRPYPVQTMVLDPCDNLGQLFLQEENKTSTKMIHRYNLVPDDHWHIFRITYYLHCSPSYKLLIMMYIISRLEQVLS